VTNTDLEEFESAALELLVAETELENDAEERRRLQVTKPSVSPPPSMARKIYSPPPPSKVYAPQAPSKEVYSPPPPTKAPSNNPRQDPPPPPPTKAPSKDPSEDPPPPSKVYSPPPLSKVSPPPSKVYSPKPYPPPQPSKVYSPPPPNKVYAPPPSPTEVPSGMIGEINGAYVTVDRPFRGFSFEADICPNTYPGIKGQYYLDRFRGSSTCTDHAVDIIFKLGGSRGWPGSSECFEACKMFALKWSDHYGNSLPYSDYNDGKTMQDKSNLDDNPGAYCCSIVKAKESLCKISKPSDSGFSKTTEAHTATRGYVNK